MPRRIATLEVTGQRDRIRRHRCRRASKELRDSVAALRAALQKSRRRQSPITDHMPSLLIAINGGVVKVTEVSNDGVKGKTLIASHIAPIAAAGHGRSSITTRRKGAAA